MQEKKRLSKKYNKYLAIILISFLGIFLFSAIIPYINAFFGAFVLYFIFNPVYQFVIRKFHCKKNTCQTTWALAIIVVISALIIVLPLIVGINLAIAELGNFPAHKESIIQSINNLDASFPSLGLKDRISSLVAGLSQVISGLFLKTAQRISRAAITLLITYFIFYYLLADQDKMKSMVLSLLPFNEENSRKLWAKFGEVTYATLIVSGLIAIIQGGIITIGFLVLGVPNAWLWGLISAILSFIPVLGVSLVWAPVGLFYLLNQNFILAIWIFVVGVFASTIDNFIRPFLQKKTGQIHPLITLIGIVIGVPFFGILGILVGPLLLSYFLMTLGMFKDEYLD
jgi:predicted PurR-regulated permease PerM